MTDHTVVPRHLEEAECPQYAGHVAGCAGFSFATSFDIVCGGDVAARCHLGQVYWYIASLVVIFDL
jgi:hypothetical protein